MHGVGDEQVIAILTHILEPYAIQVPDLEIALFLVRVTTHAAIHEAASDRPDLLASRLFAEELITLIERYLLRDEPATRPAAVFPATSRSASPQK